MNNWVLQCVAVCCSALQCVAVRRVASKKEREEERKKKNIRVLIHTL